LSLCCSFSLAASLEPAQVERLLSLCCSFSLAPEAVPPPRPSPPWRMTNAVMVVVVLLLSSCS
jgi:hypothetical protein